MAPKAIQTRYKNHHFRSRTEARFAVYFDSLGWDWDYELEGFDLPDSGYYLPDFLVKPPQSDGWFCSEFWLEVKGGEPTKEEKSKLKELCIITKKCGHFGNIGTLKKAKEIQELLDFCGGPRPRYVIPAHLFERCYYPEQRFYEVNKYSPASEHFIADEITSKLHPSRILEAEKAALSARFEHGENPESNQIVSHIVQTISGEEMLSLAKKIYETSQTPQEYNSKMHLLARLAGYNSADTLERLLDTMLQYPSG